jgi:hypothetical protein
MHLEPKKRTFEVEEDVYSAADLRWMPLWGRRLGSTLLVAHGSTGYSTRNTSLGQACGAVRRLT